MHGSCQHIQIVKSGNTKSVPAIRIFQICLYHLLIGTDPVHFGFCMFYLLIEISHRQLLHQLGMIHRSTRPCEQIRQEKPYADNLCSRIIRESAQYHLCVTV